jgi:hypothetical protein
VHDKEIEVQLINSGGSSFYHKKKIKEKDPKRNKAHLERKHGTRSTMDYGLIFSRLGELCL